VSAASKVKPATRSVTVYVGGDWDLLDEYRRLQAEAERPTSLAGADRSRLAEIEAEVRADSVTFRFRALGRRALQKLIDDNPPRSGKSRDQMLGFNEDTATSVLIRKCLVEPELSDQAVTELIEDELTDGQYEQLSNAVWALNRRSADVPFSLTGSGSIPSSAAG
jgi:hypothetical protein